MVVFPEPALGGVPEGAVAVLANGRGLLVTLNPEPISTVQSEGGVATTELDFDVGEAAEPVVVALEVEVAGAPQRHLGNSG